MSVRLSSADFSDRLTLTLGADLALSGDFATGYWINPVSLAGVMAWCLTPTTGSFGFLVTGEFPHKAYINGSAVAGSSYTMSAGTWYWVVVSRSGSTISYRVFDDSTSTTPLSTLTTTDSTNFTGVDIVTLGEDTVFNNGCVDALFTNAKIQTGVTWTNAEARTEALYYGIQKSGGTERLCWRLKDIDADTDGLNEFGGSGPNFTNTGAVADAGAPTNLSEAGGGSIGFDDGDGPVFLTRVRPATTVRLV